MRIAIVTFPGSNCDYDCYAAVKDVLGVEATYVWHRETDLGGADVVILPGGFSYGDYLRAGAIARFSPTGRQPTLRRGPWSSGLQRFRSSARPGSSRRADQPVAQVQAWTLPRIETSTPFTTRYRKGRRLRIPIAAARGATSRTGDAGRLEAERRVVFRYVDAKGATTDAANPNSSAEHRQDRERRRERSMMPHPERAVEALLGSTDGCRCSNR